MITAAILNRISGAVLGQLSPSPVRVDFGGGLVLTCPRGSDSSARTYRPEGYSPDFKLSVLALASQLSPMPEINKHVVAHGDGFKVGGERLRITDLARDAGGMVRIDLSTIVGGE